MRKAFLDPLPRGSALAEPDWRARHQLALGLLLAHIPVLAVIGGVAGRGILAVGGALLAPGGCVLLGQLMRPRRRAAAVPVTVGLASCSLALVALTGGAVAAYLHFFVLIGVVALYRDWVPLLLLLAMAVAGQLIFDQATGPVDPWAWSLLYGLAVLAAGLGSGLLGSPGEQLPEPVAPPTITADLLVNLARRNQSALYRQLELIDQLQLADRAPDAQAELGTLARLSIRVRRNADRLLVLAGEPTARTAGQPTPLRDVLTGAVADIEDVERIVFEADQPYAITGHAVTDLVHLVAELTENAVRFSPPDSAVAVRARSSHRPAAGGLVLTVEDWGVGMSPTELAAANAVLTSPTAIDRSGPPRLGLPVVARVAARHGIAVSLGATPSSGITATILLPPALVTGAARPDAEPATTTDAGSTTDAGTATVGGSASG
ncbi:MAG TPA: ATP-binding protein, partial [Pseudonocardia sp.]|nr:ATP-binding protein [Pseudonocardia sp.]